MVCEGGCDGLGFWIGGGEGWDVGIQKTCAYTRLDTPTFLTAGWKTGRAEFFTRPVRGHAALGSRALCSKRTTSRQGTRSSPRKLWEYSLLDCEEKKKRERVKNGVFGKKCSGKREAGKQGIHTESWNLQGAAR